MISTRFAKILRILPEGLFIALAKRIAYGYIKKYANIHIMGQENIDKVSGSKIFVCNHLSNSDGLILSKILKDKYDPYFIAGVKLSNDPVTSLGTKIVKTINIKPNSADKEALTNIIRVVKEGDNIFIFPEGTRSRTGSMIEAKKGIILIAKLTKAPIVPIGIWGSEKLLPINKDGDMAKEKWNHADVHIKIGETIIIPEKEKNEDKHQYENRILNSIMTGIAKQLPKEYRGFYS